MDLQVYSYGTPLYEEGGNKVHIYDWDAGKCLCGSKLTGSCTLVSVDLKWLNDNSGINLCSKCERIARNLLNKQLNTNCKNE